MKKILTFILAIVMVFAMAMCFTGCEYEETGSQKDVNNTINAANTIQSNQPTPTDISYSLERYNLIRRAYIRWMIMA